jgi:DNA polymerase III delta subunit
MAAPNPEDVLARLPKLLAKGLPPVLLITGPNDHFRAEATDLVLAAVPKDAELRVIDAADVRAGGGADAEPQAGDDADDSAAEADDAGTGGCPELQELRGGGLFARTAVIVIRRGAAWWRRHGGAVAAQAAKFQRGSSLVVEAAKLDKRKRAVAAFQKQVADSGAEFEFRELYDAPFDRSRSPLEGELCRWVVRRAARLGVPLQPEAAWLLTAQVGKSLSELLAELGRLRAQLGASAPAQPLGPDDLRGRIACSFEATPFDLADALLGGDRRGALRAARAMFERGVRGKDGRTTDAGGVLPFTTSWLHQTLATVYEGRLLLDGGVPLRDLPQRVGVRGFADRFVEQVRRNDLPRLRRGLLALRHCQRMVRLSGEEPGVLLEQFLAQWFERAPIPTAEDLEL